MGDIEIIDDDGSPEIEIEIIDDDGGDQPDLESAPKPKAKPKTKHKAKPKMNPGGDRDKPDRSGEYERRRKKAKQARERAVKRSLEATPEERAEELRKSVEEGKRRKSSRPRGEARPQYTRASGSGRKAERLGIEIGQPTRRRKDALGCAGTPEASEHLRDPKNREKLRRMQDDDKTARWRAVARHYIAGPPGVIGSRTLAYLSVYSCTYRAATRGAARLWADPEFLSVLDAEAEDIRAATKIDANWVLSQAALILDQSLGRSPITEEVPIMDADRAADADANGEIPTVEVTRRSYNSQAALKSLELIGRNVLVGAFNDAITVNTDGLADKLRERQRALESRRAEIEVRVRGGEAESGEGEE